MLDVLSFLMIWLNFFMLSTASSLHIVLRYLTIKSEHHFTHENHDKKRIPSLYIQSILDFRFITYLFLWNTTVSTYRHYRFEDLVDPTPDAVLMVCALYSIYFLIGNVVQFTPFGVHHRYTAYLFLSVILIFQSFIAYMGAMHAPPYWIAFIINCMFVLLAHFVLYPIFELWRKYSN